MYDYSKCMVVALCCLILGVHKRSCAQHLSPIAKNYRERSTITVIVREYPLGPLVYQADVEPNAGACLTNRTTLNSGVAVFFPACDQPAFWFTATKAGHEMLGDNEGFIRNPETEEGKEAVVLEIYLPRKKSRADAERQIRELKQILRQQIPKLRREPKPRYLELCRNIMRLDQEKRTLADEHLRARHEARIEKDRNNASNDMEAILEREFRVGKAGVKIREALHDEERFTQNLFWSSTRESIWEGELETAMDALRHHIEGEDFGALKWPRRKAYIELAMHIAIALENVPVEDHMRRLLKAGETEPNGSIPHQDDRFVSLGLDVAGFQLNKDGKPTLHLGPVQSSKYGDVVNPAALRVRAGYYLTDRFSVAIDYGYVTTRVDPQPKFTREVRIARHQMGLAFEYALISVAAQGHRGFSGFSVPMAVQGGVESSYFNSVGRYLIIHPDGKGIPIRYNLGVETGVQFEFEHAILGIRYFIQQSALPGNYVVKGSYGYRYAVVSSLTNGFRLTATLVLDKKLRQRLRR